MASAWAFVHAGGNSAANEGKRPRANASAALGPACATFCAAAIVAGVRAALRSASQRGQAKRRCHKVPTSPQNLHAGSGARPRRKSLSCVQVDPTKAARAALPSRWSQPGGPARRLPLKSGWQTCQASGAAHGAADALARSATSDQSRVSCTANAATSRGETRPRSRRTPCRVRNLSAAGAAHPKRANTRTSTQPGTEAAPHWDLAAAIAVFAPDSTLSSTRRGGRFRKTARAQSSTTWAW